MNKRQANQQGQQRGQASQAQPGGPRRGSDAQERFGPGSSPQGRGNDASENAPSREDFQRSRGGSNKASHG
jgi:hypothetical protein